MSNSGPPPGAFARWLGTELRARRLSQRGLAKRSGVAHSTISRLLHGDRVPTLATATRIAGALGTLAGRDILADQRVDRSPVWRVRAALEDDPLLSAVDVAAVMRRYLRVRNDRRSGQRAG